MFMLLKEDIQNLIIKCESVMTTNEIKYKRNKKEIRTFTKVLEKYEVSEDNEIVFNEINNRLSDLVIYQSDLKEENKWLKVVIRKLKSLIDNEDINIQEDTEDNEIGQLE